LSEQPAWLRYRPSDADRKGFAPNTEIGVALQSYIAQVMAARASGKPDRKAEKILLKMRQDLSTILGWSPWSEEQMRNFGSPPEVCGHKLAKLLTEWYLSRLAEPGFALDSRCGAAEALIVSLVGHDGFEVLRANVRSEQLGRFHGGGNGCAG